MSSAQPPTVDAAEVEDRRQERQVEDHDLGVAEGHREAGAEEPPAGAGVGQGLGLGDGGVPHLPGEEERGSRCRPIFSAAKAVWKVSASTARPKTAQASQIASPIHIAARNGSTERGPRVSTRATSAAIDGPGEPEATVSAGGEDEERRRVEHAGASAGAERSSATRAKVTARALAVERRPWRAVGSAPRPGGARMRTILVANRKGGCGKTMVAITLAAALARAGRRRWRWPTPTRRSRRCAG